MATPHAPATSPTSSTFMHVPTTPQDSAVKPNPHPYAIRTTSTGILTRSSSTGHNPASRHHYVPLSPAPKEDRKRHRYSKSLAAEPLFEFKAPSPLPVPTTFTGTSRGQKRYSWDNSVRSNRPVQDSVFLSAAASEDLPSNPKLWSTSELVTHLATALQVPVDDSEPLSASSIDEIITFVKQAGISGRIFLRLMEDDLDQRGVSPAGRDALLAVSRNLRQNVIKGRIWGDDDLPESLSPSLPSHPFSSALYNSSSSSIDLTDDEQNYKQRRRHRGRVHGMVQSFERSGSFSSESSVERDDSPDDNSWLKDTIKVVEPACMSPVNDPIPLISSSPTVPAAEEPSVEVLLAESEQSGAWGARAWEEFDMTPGVTVKRVEELEHDSDIRADTVTRLQTLAAFGSVKKAKSVRLPKTKQDRRVITAIFAPPVDESPEPAGPDVPPVVSAAQDEATEVQDPSHDMVTHTDMMEQVQPAATERELALAAELAETQAMVRAFKARLEEVERKVADLEVTIHRNETEREKLVSLGLAAKGAEDSMVMVNEFNIFTGHESDTSTLLEVDDDAVDDSKPFPARPPEDTIETLENNPAERRDNQESNTDTSPSTVGELPHYVLLVGLGVCAVVLRVILKKGVGRGSGIGWRW